MARDEAVSMNVKGLQELRRTMEEKLPKQVQSNVMAAALKEAGRPMKNAAKANARRGRSGALAQAITFWNEKKKVRDKKGKFARVHLGPKRSLRGAIKKYYAYYGRKNVSIAALKNGIRHGHLVEFGTSKMAARPFLRPAQAAHDKKLIQVFGRILGEKIEKAAEKEAQKTKGGKGRSQ